MRLLTTVFVVLTIVLASCNGGSNDGSSRKPDVYDLPADKSLDKAVSDKKMSVVSFTLPDSEVCGVADSIFRVASTRFSDVKFISVNVNLHKDLLDNLKVEAVPAILVIRKNGQRDWHIGPMTSDELDAVIKNAQE